MPHKKFKCFCWLCVIFPILQYNSHKQRRGFKLGIFGILLTIHANTNQIHPRSLHAVQHFMHVNLSAQTAVDAGDICTWQTMVYFDHRKTLKIPDLSPTRELKWCRFWELHYPSVHITRAGSFPFHNKSV